MAIREAGLTDLICVTEKKNLYIIKKINLVDFLNSTHILTARLKHPTEICKNISLNLIQVKPLDRLAAGLKHHLKLP